jgi:phospholipid/cholesterol/gamma-HCH transport system substrate-binding protein
MKDSAVETAIGAIVIAIAAAFLIFVYNTTDRASARSGYHVVAEFDNIGAVNVGTDVRLAGIKVGSVVAQELDPQSYQARVTMMIDPKLKLTDDTTAKVSSEGILGQPFISLEPGGSETLIADGGEIQFTQGAIDIWKLVSEAMFSKSESSSSAPPPTEKTAAPPQAPETSAPAESSGGPSTAESPEAPTATDPPQSSPAPDAQPNAQQQ